MPFKGLLLFPPSLEARGRDSVTSSRPFRKLENTDTQDHSSSLPREDLYIFGLYVNTVCAGADFWLMELRIESLRFLLEVVGRRSRELIDSSGTEARFSLGAFLLPNVLLYLIQG